MNKLPRGLRNNNPCNIVKGCDWQGLVKGTDTRFCKFVNMAYGYRAAFRTLWTYYDKHGLNTIRQWISRWAPTNENQTELYIRAVCAAAHLEPDTRIVFFNRKSEVDLKLSCLKIIEIVSAMSMIENGVKAKYDEVKEGFRLAFPEEKAPLPASPEGEE